MLRTVTRASLQARRQLVLSPFRALSTLQSNPQIYVFPDPRHPTNHILTFLPSSPPTVSLAIGTTSELPPTPSSLRENPTFLRYLHHTIATNAHADPQLQAQAAALASSSGSMLLQPNRREYAGSTGASGQGGAGGGGRGGWIHVFDDRHPPAFGRTAEPEDIFGSLEVDGQGRFVDPQGNYRMNETYRIVTREGMLRLSPFMREKLVEALGRREQRLKEES